MKKKALVILAAILLISSFSACKDNAKGTDDNQSFVNYTDTGEGSSSMNSKTADIEHSTVSSDSTVDSVEAVGGDNSDDNSSTAHENSNPSDSSSGKEVASTVPNTVNTITYYFENEVDTESDTPQTSSEEHDSDSDSENDTDSDNTVDTDTDTEAVSSQPAEEEPVPAGSYTEEDIAFYYNGEKIYLGDSIDSVTEIVGEPNSIDSNTYNYDEFWITVTDLEDIEEKFVETIQIFKNTQNTLQTEKGIKIGMSSEDIVKAYGSSNIIVDGEQRYYVGNKYMYFDVQNDIIANMGYRIDHEVVVDDEAN